MPIGVYVRDGRNDRAVDITPNGEMVVSAIKPNISVHHKMDTINTAYNFAPIVTGKRMILQNILVYGNKNVGINDATVTIYTADALESTTPIRTVLEFEVPEKQSRDIIGLNLDLGSGVFLNATTDDNDVFLTMMGYYVDDHGDDQD